MQIKDRVFYVTGGASGLGLATVCRLAEHGAAVVILDLNKEEGEKQASQFPGAALFRQCDVRSEEDVLGAIKTADEKWPGKLIGGLVHCAGTAMVGKTVGNDGTPFDLATFRDVIDINLACLVHSPLADAMLKPILGPKVGTFNVARLVAARIIQSYPQPSRARPLVQDHGILIFASSSSYQDGQMGQAAYASSKGGVASLVLPMARDLSRYGIRVNAIAPSLFETAMGKLSSPEVRANLLKAVEFPPRFGNADEFASLAIECIRNEYLNGTGASEATHCIGSSIDWGKALQ